jgi:GntR family transcriptional regulator
MKPLYTQVSDYVLEKIQSGEWPVGHMIPTEMELCKQFNLSRSSVRTALLSLVNDGYLVRSKGRGTFVTTPQRVEESTVFIESFAEEMHKRGYEVETEVLEFRVMRADEEIREHLQLEPGANVIKLSRLRYCKDRFEDGPIVLTTSYYTMKLEYLQNYDFSKTSVHKVMAEHNMAKKYTEKHINVAFLDARSSRLMSVENGSLALFVTSHTRDLDDELIEYCESYYPANRNEFIIKIRL